MEKNNKDIEEFDNLELIKVIYKEILEIKALINNKTEEQDKKFDSLDNKIDKISKNLDDLSRNEKSHFEYTTNKFNRLEQKLDSNFKYLDEKNDSTKNKLVLDINDILDNFSIATTKSINNLENKIKN